MISLHHLQSNCSLYSLKLLIRAYRVSLKSMSQWSSYHTWHYILNIEATMYIAACIHHIKVTVHNSIKILDYWSRDMLKFDFLEKSVGIVSPLHFVYDSSRKIFLILYSINWPNFIVCLLLLLEILDNIYIGIVCFAGCDVINFENYLTFLNKSIFYMDKKSRQKFKYLESDKNF